MLLAHEDVNFVQSKICCAPDLYDYGRWSPWVDVRLIQEHEPPCILSSEPECRRAGFRFPLNHTGRAARGSAHLLGCKCELSLVAPGRNVLLPQMAVRNRSLTDAHFSPVQKVASLAFGHRVR